MQNNLSEPVKAVGNYLLYDQIGKGTFGEVRLALPAATQATNASQYLACKVISLRKKQSRPTQYQNQTQMLREVSILKSQVPHPNIV
jgi:serine/threonine protein kinase